MGVLRQGFPRTWVVLFACVSFGVSGLPPLETYCGAAPPPPKEGVKRSRDSKWTLPFNAADVVDYFEDVLSVPKRQGEGNAVIFESGSSTREEDRYRIIVDQEEGDVVVSFAVAGHNGMEIVREFFESRFFKRSESEQLYKLLQDAELSPTLKLERFSVSARAWETPDRVHLVLRFFRPDRRVTLEYRHRTPRERQSRFR